MGRTEYSADLSACPLVEEDADMEESLAPPHASYLSEVRGKVALTVLFTLGLAIGAACVVSGNVSDAQRSSGIFSGIVDLAAQPPKHKVSTCSADGEACLESGCCVPGGSSGLTCYKKTDDWASCAPSCEPGVHEPEKEGHWDETGTFVKAEWSCEKIGKPSQPGCDAFGNNTKSDCPTDYCMLKGDSCLPKCDSFGNADACWKSTTCMWEEEKCMDACWDHDTAHACGPSDKCHWTGDKCQMGWWLFDSPESCPSDLHYMWNGSCVQDPCSADGEDCSKTKCCSMERGASGKTCFKKDNNWAACQETCDHSDDWSCEALGKRANYSAGCAWAGSDCSQTKTCCNRGFVCAVKDAEFTGCVLTEKTSSWVSQSVPIPADWDGTVVGPGRDEYEVAKAGPDDQKIGNTLYCFMAYLPGSYEDGLVAASKELKAGIYGCDEHDLFHTWESGNGAWDTGEATLQNTDVFINVWEQVQVKGKYINYDWTIKADPDCVFSPQRMKEHIDTYTLPSWTAAYLKNNGLDKGMGNNGFLGAIEIFTKKAVSIYLDNAAGCREALGLEAGEDGFMKGCMDGLGVGFLEDVDIFFPDNGPGACMNAARVAFHPLKDPDDWKHCWEIVLGKVPY